MTADLDRELEARFAPLAAARFAPTPEPTALRDRPGRGEATGGRRARYRPVVLGAAAALVLLATGVAALAWWARPDDAPVRARTGPTAAARPGDAPPPLPAPGGDDPRLVFGWTPPDLAVSGCWRTTDEAVAASTSCTLEAIGSACTAPAPARPACVEAPEPLGLPARLTVVARLRTAPATVVDGFAARDRDAIVAHAEQLPGDGTGEPTVDDMDWTSLGGSVALLARGADRLEGGTDRPGRVLDAALVLVDGRVVRLSWDQAVGDATVGELVAKLSLDPATAGTAVDEQLLPDGVEIVAQGDARPLTAPAAGGHASAPGVRTSIWWARPWSTSAAGGDEVSVTVVRDVDAAGFVDGWLDREAPEGAIRGLADVGGGHAVTASTGPRTSIALAVDARTAAVVTGPSGPDLVALAASVRVGPA